MRHARADYDRIQDPEGKIPAAEPVFLIRGQDRAAVPALVAYASEALKLGATFELVAAVIRQANAMREWQKEHGGKVPDMPTEK